MKERIKMFENKKDKNEEEIKPTFKRRMTYNAFTMKLLKFNSITTEGEKKEEKQEKNIPKKIDMKRYSLKLEESIKKPNTLRENRQINKIDITKHLNDMEKEKNKMIVQEEISKIPPKKISI